MKKVLALLGILVVGSAKADDISLVAHGFSHHLDNHHFNQNDYGAAIRYDKDDFGLQIGGYRNSINNNSFYAGVDWSPYQRNISGCVDVSAGAFYGATTGYKYAVTPIVGLQGAIKCDKVFARVRVFPDFIYNSKAVAAVEFGVVLGVARIGLGLCGHAEVAVGSQV